ncbi:hypothetical protein Bca52824_027386 [Brassica carinata]|uniref:CCHC-type domain-containing protein n=1 Tax=Brassica carinata TaxID=52824 RepID=A0A8X7SJK0_BRACI|nr:hypothetical protein Bca52824_027386 [Brassica carinata]
METATSEIPLYSTIYETGGPSTFPAMGSAYAPGGSTPYGDPYATQSSYYGQGGVMFSGVGDGYVDPHRHPYHTMTYLGGSYLYQMCYICGDAGHLAVICTRYVEMMEIPYLPCTQPGAGSTECGRCPNCTMLLYIWRP